MKEKNLKILFVTKYVAGCLPGEFTYHGEWTATFEFMLALKTLCSALEIYLLTPKVREEHEERFENEFAIILKKNNIKHFFADVYLDYASPPEVFRWHLFKKEKALIKKYTIKVVQYGQIGRNYSYFFKSFLGIKKIICYSCFDNKKEWVGKREDNFYKIKSYSLTSPLLLNKLKKIVFLLFSRFLRIEVFDHRVDYFVSRHLLGFKLLKEKYPELNIKYIPKGHSNPLKVYPKKLDKIRNILFMGNLQYGKGIMDILKITEDFPELNFNIVGSGNVDIEEKIKMCKKKYKNINFLGSVNYYEKWKVYLESDVFLLPSYKDTLPSVILEALSCALPVITTYEVDSPIKDGENGFLFPAGDLNELKEKIKLLQNNLNLYSQMSQGALETAKKYIWENAAKKFLEIYYS